MVWSWILSGVLFGFGAGFLFGRFFRQSSTPDDEEVQKWRAEAERTVAARIERRLAQIESRTREQGRITCETVAMMFSIRERSAERYLVVLQERGVLRQIGRGVNAYYELMERAV